MRKLLFAGLLLPGLAWAQTYTITIPPITVTVQPGTVAVTPTPPAPVVTPTPTPAPVVTPPAPTPVPPAPGPVATGCPPGGAKWTNLVINPASNINALMSCAAPGFKLVLMPGTYPQVFHIPVELNGFDLGGMPGGAANVILDGQGGCTVAQNNAGGAGCNRLAWGKGIIHTSAAGIIHDLTVTRGGSNAVGGHDGQAGIYIEQDAVGPVTIRNVMARDNENGIFSSVGNTQAVILFDRVDFVDNGTDGGSHSAYMGGGASLTLRNIHDYGSRTGNNQKSRIAVVNVEGDDTYNKSVQGRWVECADGCKLTMSGNGIYNGNTCCQNVFGNGDESTKFPPSTTWTGGRIWLGRASDFSTPGPFTMTAVTLTCGSGSSAINDKGQPLTGMPACTAGQPYPDPPYISGAK